jgi:hypothetical protein
VCSSPFPPVAYAQCGLGPVLCVMKTCTTQGAVAAPHLRLFNFERELLLIRLAGLHGHGARADRLPVCTGHRAGVRRARKTASRCTPHCSGAGVEQVQAGVGLMAKAFAASRASRESSSLKASQATAASSARSLPVPTSPGSCSASGASPCFFFLRFLTLHGWPPACRHRRSTKEAQAAPLLSISNIHKISRTFELQFSADRHGPARTTAQSSAWYRTR